MQPVQVFTVIPDQLGPYRIERILGRGGMGAVYKGVNIETDELAAIKLLPASLAQETDFRQRFEAEIETLRKLYHPNIVQLFGFGEQDGVLFYAMELVDGKSLEEQLRDGRRFDWREVAEIGIHTCRALRHAHDRGIIHRDLKPANLLLSQENHVKLSDFGIARFFGDARITMAGNVVGTIEYMAPEQADARPVGPRTDLYSLGGVLYSLLARRPPYRARSLVEVFEKQRSGPPDPIRMYVPEIPEEMDRLVAQLLERDPENRPANATLVARRLELLAKTPFPVVRAPRSPGEAAQADAQRKPADVVPATRTMAHTCDLLPLEAKVILPDRPARPAQPANFGFEVNLSTVKPEAAPGRRLTDAGAGGPESTGRTTAERSTGRFVVVAQDDLDPMEPEPPPRAALISLHTWVLIAGLILMACSAWYFLQPPSADALHARIAAVIADRSTQSLLEAEADILEFVLRYSDDPRARRLQEYQKEIELYRLERRFDQRAKGMGSGNEDLLPIERAYVEAINLAWLEPERGLAKLRAIVDLYGDLPETKGAGAQCFELACRQVKKIERQFEQSEAMKQRDLRGRLQRIEELAQTDPKKAAAMVRAAMELYRDKPWAEPTLERLNKMSLEPKAEKGTKK